MLVSSTNFLIFILIRDFICLQELHNGEYYTIKREIRPNNLISIDAGKSLIKLMILLNTNGNMTISVEQIKEAIGNRRQ